MSRHHSSAPLPGPRVGRWAGWLGALIAAAMLLALGSGAPAVAQGDALAPSPIDEASYVDAINEIRVEHGLAPLQVDPNMTEAARDWTAWMVANSTLQHADDIVTGAPDNWLRAGENVGRGPTVPRVWQAFLDSPGHRANVLDPSYTLVGVGVIWNEADGRHYTTHRFASTLDDLDQAEFGEADNAGPPVELAAVQEPQPDPAATAVLATTLELLVEAGR